MKLVSRRFLLAAALLAALMAFGGGAAPRFHADQCAGCISASSSMQAVAISQ